MNANLEFAEEAFHRLHHAINERRKASTTVKVPVEDLKALLYAYQKALGKSEEPKLQ